MFPFNPDIFVFYENCLSFSFYFSNRDRQKPVLVSAEATQKKYESG
jgi:hypothetical protein